MGKLKFIIKFFEWNNPDFQIETIDFFLWEWEGNWDEKKLDSFSTFLLWSGDWVFFWGGFLLGWCIKIATSVGTGLFAMAFYALFLWHFMPFFYGILCPFSMAFYAFFLWHFMPFLWHFMPFFYGILCLFSMVFYAFFLWYLHPFFYGILCLFFYGILCLFSMAFYAFFSMVFYAFFLWHLMPFFYGIWCFFSMAFDAFFLWHLMPFSMSLRAILHFLPSNPSNTPWAGSESSLQKAPIHINPITKNNNSQKSL